MGSEDLGLVGFLAGIVFTRITLITATSIAGTILIGIGVLVLGQSLHIPVYETCQERPPIAWATLGGFLLVSVVLQVMLTRPDRAPQTAPAKPAA